MAKKSKDTTPEVSLTSSDPATARPRLSKLIIKNFRCIDSTPVEIELDDIVVLVGPNNVGKSSILRAYEVVMSQGSGEGKLTIDDFPGSKIDPNNLPEIILHTIIYDNAPGEEWIHQTGTGENEVIERWTWADEGNPKRQGYNKNNEWDEKVPWGAPNVANSRRPQPHRVDAFDDPKKQADEIVKLLSGVLNERVKGMKNAIEAVASDGEKPDSEKSNYEKLLSQVKEIQKTIVRESAAEIDKVQKELSQLISEVFPNYEIRFDAKPEDDLEKSIALFKANPQLYMGPKDGYQSTIERQGSGARRTLLWTALRIISETKQETASKEGSLKRPHVLLLDEPELCLHPNAIREACNLLYSLPKSGNWQVMITTHSPAFIDISKNNTTIIRVERSMSGSIKGTTVFRPDRVQLDDDDRKRLKMMNICDPYVAEFFFGGRTIVVEGDTEYTAFKYVAASDLKKYSNVHIICARGKATIVTLVKILNHFGSSYSVLHDSDTLKVTTKKGKEMKNPAWKHNNSIREETEKKPSHTKVRLLASIPNFEAAYFGEEVDGDKPYNALMEIKADSASFKAIEQLFNALIDHSKPLPENCVEWSDIKELEKRVTN